MWKPSFNSNKENTRGFFRHISRKESIIAMLNYLTLIFGCQLAGELLVTASGLPLPGPVVGMVLLFLFLVVRGRLVSPGVPAQLAAVGDGLLSHLSLLFVPAGVGVMAHFALLEADWIALSTAIIGSSVLTIIVTAYTLLAIRKMAGGSQTGAAGDE